MTNFELGVRAPWNECTKCNRTDIDFMGYSLRSDRWRYTEWAAWDKARFAPLWGSVNDSMTELYDHQGDVGDSFDTATPTANVAAAPEHAALVSFVRKPILPAVHGAQKPGPGAPAWALYVPRGHGAATPLAHVKPGGQVRQSGPPSALKPAS